MTDIRLSIQLFLEAAVAQIIRVGCDFIPFCWGYQLEVCRSYAEALEAIRAVITEFSN